jgi:predicted nucleic acid-binding protein
MEKDMQKYMFDTNVFKNILKNNICLDVFYDGELYITHIQKDEIMAYKNVKKRNELLKIFNILEQEELPTESLVLGTSRLGMARIGDGVLFTNIKNDLDKIEIKENNIEDALIAETAILNEITLVTFDNNLAVIAKLHGCSVRYFSIHNNR